MEYFLRDVLYTFDNDYINYVFNVMGADATIENYYIFECLLVDGKLDEFINICKLLKIDEATVFNHLKHSYALVNCSNVKQYVLNKNK